MVPAEGGSVSDTSELIPFYGLRGCRVFRERLPQYGTAPPRPLNPEFDLLISILVSVDCHTPREVDPRGSWPLFTFFRPKYVKLARPTSPKKSKYTRGCHISTARASPLAPPQVLNYAPLYSEVLRYQNKSSQRQANPCALLSGVIHCFFDFDIASNEDRIGADPPQSGSPMVWPQEQALH